MSDKASGIDYPSSFLGDAIDRRLQSRWVFHLLVSFICMLLVGIPLIYQSPYEINPDTYLYLSIANYYLGDPTAVWRDANTVGPVLPALLALIKLGLTKVTAIGYNPDFLIIKSGAFLCYLIILNGAGYYIRQAVRPGVVLAFLVLLLVLNQASRDNLSLNGELLSITFLTLLLIQLQNQGKRYGLAILCVLCVLVIYTKIQSVVILALMLYEGLYKRNNKLHQLAVIAASLLFVEAIFYAHGIGLVRNALNLFHYVTSAQRTADGGFSSAELVKLILGNRFIYNIPWALKAAVESIPVFSFVLLSLFLSGEQSKLKLQYDWRLWLPAVFFTILASGRPFEHYILYLMLFVIVFSAPILAKLSGVGSSRNSNTAYLVVTLVFLVVAKVDTWLIAKESGLLWVREIPEYTLGKEMDAVAEQLRRDPGRFLVHGWDFQVYSYLNGWYDGLDLSWVKVGQADSIDYLNDILRKRYKYIIDVVGYSGIVDDASDKMSGSTIYAAVLSKHYRQLSDSNGLRLFRLIDGQPLGEALAKPHEVNYSIIEQSIGCATCLPQLAVGRGGRAASWGTYESKSDRPAGGFKVSFSPQGTFAMVRYIVSSDSNGMAINLQRFCKSGEVLAEPLDIGAAKADKINELYFDVNNCDEDRIVLEFLDSGRESSQGIGFVGLEVF